MMIRSRLSLAAAAAAAIVLTVPLQAVAQTASGEGRTLHIVVPFTTGGAQDVIGRFLGAQLSARLGVPVVIDNKGGAGGTIAAESVAKAAPDGNTLLLATGGAITIAPALNTHLPYDPRRDFTPVALVADTPMTLAVRAQSPYQTLADLLQDARKRPGEVSFGSTGNGTISHLSGELLAQGAGVKLLHVPYRGAGPALTDLIGGQIAAMVTSTASIDPMADDGKARVLATFTRQRLPSMRGAPTVNEAAGVNGLEVPVWVGLMAPARTPPAIVEKLAAEILAICRQPQTDERFKALGAVTTCGGQRDLDDVVKADAARWERVIRQGAIKVE